MEHVGTILATSLALYAIGTGLFLILEDRRPQATLAWMLGFVFAPGAGLLVYLLFGTPSDKPLRPSLVTAPMV